MQHKFSLQKTSWIQLAVGLIIVGLTTYFYVSQLNQAVVNNTMETISELAQHDKRSIEAFIETCWDELDGIAQRFISYNCQTVQDVEARINLECATSDFSSIYLLAADGRIYTDKFVVYEPEQVGQESKDILRGFFAGGDEHIVARWNDPTGIGKEHEYVLYGIRLRDFSVDGVEMSALIGLSETQNIQNYIILDSFVKDGQSHGYSAVVSTAGDYVFGTHETLYQSEADNLFERLRQGRQLELNQAQITQRMQRGETFSFHYTTAQCIRELIFFMPFSGNIDWYFVMVIENQAFTEQSQTFVRLSVSVQVFIMLVILVLVLVISRSHSRTTQAMAKARAQGEFLSNMSHEIRTPLNGLIGLNHLIMSHIDEPEQAGQIKDWLRKSHSTANYLLSLVNDVLDMSKLQAGKVDIIREPVLLETLIDAVWSMQRDNIERRGIHFEIEQDIKVPCISGDDTRIKQVLMNIVGNAAKFTPKGGTVTLSISQEQMDDNHVRTFFRCKDTGVGMTAEFKAQIFDAFSQERNKITESVKGTGLGMAISKLLVTAMGGDIEVESEPNVGTTFTVIIPAEISTEAPEYMEQATPENLADAEALTDAMHKDHHPIKILIAEDNALNAEILIDILSEEGFEVVHAENGQEAVDMFAASALDEFDIILMDMQMPVMDGCTAAQTIRRLPRADAAGVLIFACTANTFKEDRDKALASGMDDFLAKPIDVHVMLKKLNARKKPEKTAG